jgi:transposase-like protein
MIHDHSALLAQLDALTGADSASVFTELIRAGLQALIEVEATDKLGAGRYERTTTRTTHRNGHRTKTVVTTSGDVDVKIPKLRSGSFFPSLLERMMAAVKTIFAHTNPVEVTAQWDQVTDTFTGSFPKAAALMEATKHDVLAFTAFPKAHWQKIWSNNPRSVNRPSHDTIMSAA